MKNIEPPQAIRDAMEKQMKAERERREQILIAEGHKQSAILEAEGQKQSMILQAEAQKESAIQKAKGEAEAIREVQKAKAEGLKMLKDAGMDDAVLKLKEAPIEDMGFARPDLHRGLRQGRSEVIYAFCLNLTFLYGFGDTFNQCAHCLRVG